MRIRPVIGLFFSITLLAACGSSEDEQRKDAFCEDVPDLLKDITSDMGAVGSDPESAVALIEDAVDKLNDVEPPEDVSDEWDRLVTAWTDMRDLLGEADLEDPTANADLAPELQRIQPELIESGSAVDDWGMDNC